MELREIAIESLVRFPEHVRVLVDHRLHDRELPDEIDEAVELARVDLDGCLTRSALETDPASALQSFLGIQWFIRRWSCGRRRIVRPAVAEAIERGYQDRVTIVEIGASTPRQTILDVVHHAAQQIDRR